jgi:hypothetical protein
MTTVDELRGRIAAIEGRQIELAGERDELAFEAVVAGNAKAAKRVAEIAAELVHLQNEVATLNAALAEAGRRAASASAAEAVEAERLRAEQAQPIAERLADRGKKMDAAAKVICEERAGIEADSAELARLGVPVASADLRRVNLRRWFDAAFISFDAQSRPVPPLDRHSADSLTKNWAGSMLTWLANKLNKNAAKAA